MSITLNGIDKHFSEKKILDNFCYTFPKSGCVVLMGTSGCGKTTLLRTIAGLAKQSSGSVSLPSGAKISMVFQEDRLLESLDVLGNVNIVLGKNSQDNTDYSLQCLERLGLLEASAKRISQLSGGMQRRVALARAVAFGGDILLLDEPFKGLDLETKKIAADFVFNSAKEKNAIIIFITHDIDEALLYGDYLLILSGPPLNVSHTIVCEKESEGQSYSQQRKQLLDLLLDTSGNFYQDVV